MAWFLGQSLPVIFLAFVLGVLVGWLWWGRQRRKVAGAEAATVPAVADRPEPVRLERDAEVTRALDRVEVDEPARPVALVAAAPIGGTFLESPVEAGTYAHAAAQPEPEPEPAPAPEPEPAPEPAEAAADAESQHEPEPEPEPEAAPEPDDDLQRIEGIGPKMALALQGAGIRTYRQLAVTDVERLRTAIEANGLRFAPSLTTWARQARLLADGDEEGFAELTRRLVAGRDVGQP